MYDEKEESLDFETEPIAIRDEDEVDYLPSQLMSDEQARMISTADLDNALDEFASRFNARDLDGLGELLAPDAEADFLKESSRDGVVEGINDLILRYPTLLATRGDIGPEPIVVVWIFDQDQDRFEPFGYLTLQLSDSDESLVQRVDYVEELPDSEDLVVEKPERSELPDWEDWSEFDEE